MKLSINEHTNKQKLYQNQEFFTPGTKKKRVTTMKRVLVGNGGSVASATGLQ